MQAACNEDVFRVLLADFDVRMECFASPMNCHFTRQYCSAFPDVDTVFGSRGSFFAFRPVSGSFHANPPFIDDIIERMARHMDELLAGTSQPLSFIVVVPHRAKTSAWKVLSSSVHNRYHLLLKVPYCDLNRNLWNAPFNLRNSVNSKRHTGSARAPNTVVRHVSRCPHATRRSYSFRMTPVVPCCPPRSAYCSS